MQTVSTRDLEREIKAAELLRRHIEDLVGEDADAIRDGIEGETNLFEIIGRMVEADGEDKALIEGVSAYQKEIAARKSRIESRIETRRALMATAMELAELKKLETPAGTISRKPLPAKAIVTDESQIPSEFFEPQPPKLDKAALTAALRDKRDIPGAVLSNPSQTIAIRK